MNKHPKALVMLFFTEMWERFSFYGMRALLILYLTKQLFEHILEPEKSNIAYGIYAAYGALVYATPFIGGLIADKFLGPKKAIVWGAILMAIGHFVMAIETEFWLYVALAFLILGNGFFKPNISSIVGELYDKGDIRRDGGFTIFYMGVNLGAFLSPLACGMLGELVGWEYGFGLAGLGMIAGLFIFQKNKDLLNVKEKLIITETGTEKHEVPANIGDPPHPDRLQKSLFFGINTETLIYAVSIISVGFIALLISNYEVMSYFLTPFAIAVILIIIIKAFVSEKVERERLFVILILLVFTTLFWAFFEQAGSSLTLFTYGNVDRSVFNFRVPTSLFQSVNPLFILILASPFTMLWLKLAEKKKEPNTPVKFGLGLLLLGLGFIVLGISPNFMQQTELLLNNETYRYIIIAATVPMTFLILSYMLQTMGELCLSPIGLSMVTRLASPKIVGMVLGAWFLSSAMAHHIGGVIAKTTSVKESSVDVMWKTIEDNYSKAIFYQDSIISPNKTEKPHDSIYQKEFSHTYKGLISNSLLKGFEVILIQGNTINSEEKGKSFNYAQILDSSFVAYEKLHISRIVKDSVAYKNLLTQAFKSGIDHMIEVGNIALNHAEKEGYIESNRESLSITSKHSLSNLLQFTGVFYTLGLIAVAASILLFLLAPGIKKMMHGA
ncbi:MAG: peptide MFS transporter [Bacteroidales bacterium]|jgi:POT family proton-dependent oligopeptide transporter|nr:peptide MFS transporter [Bacteroidales bacterium]